MDARGGYDARTAESEQTRVDDFPTDRRSTACNGSPGTRRVGHAGTLDPLATGVLVVAIGAATRLIEYVQRMPKGYLGTFLLGRQSPTEDIEGEVTELENPPRPTLEEVTAAARAFVGPIHAAPAGVFGPEGSGPPGVRLGPQGASGRTQTPRSDDSSARSG